MEQEISVLLIEDDAEYASLIDRYVDEACGDSITYKMARAETLRHGLELLRKNRFEIVLLDLRLPDGDGIETLTRLRAQHSEVPVVVLTNLNQARFGIEAISAGAQDFLEKHRIDPRRLRASIAFALERSRRQSVLHELEKIRAEVRERRKLDNLKDGLIRTVAHELRTPVTVIHAHLQNLYDGLAGPLSARQNEILQRSKLQMERLIRLINNFLDLTRLESGRARMRRRDFDIGRLIEGVIADFRVVHASSGTAIRLISPRCAVPAFGDPDLVEQMLTNLLDNALRHAREEITVRLMQAGTSAVSVGVIDDGPGLRTGNPRALFDKFVQLDRPRGGAGYKGTGLGLSICLEIAKAHRGRIWGCNVAGKGAGFYFTIPKKAEEPEHATRDA